MILILGPDTDEHAVYVRDSLRQRGLESELFDVSLYPQDVGISFHPCENDGVLLLQTGRRVCWSEIDCVYWRSYDRPGVPELPDPDQQWVAENDARGLVETFLRWTGTRWVNSWDAWVLHRSKPLQLAAVASLELPHELFVPATTVCNDAADVVEFVGRHGSCVFKPVQGGAHARPLEERHLTPENLELLAMSPVTIQQRIEGTDIRVFVAGNQVHACEVRATTLDFRDDDQVRFARCELPANIREACIRIAALLQLAWTGIDLRRTSKGQYAFFEANPSPMFIGFEVGAGLPLTDALISLLTT